MRYADNITVRATHVFYSCRLYKMDIERRKKLLFVHFSICFEVFDILLDQIGD